MGGLAIRLKEEKDGKSTSITPEKKELFVNCFTAKIDKN